MAQVIINTGNVANDGLGTPLRNAFDQVNYNFTQLFNAGPSGSNIVIANNSITVTNTNGNLRLATNGIGSIVPAANFVPDIPNVRSIGAGTNRFNTIYSQYVNANTGTFAGNVYVAGNLQVTGNVITVNYSNLSVSNVSITLGTGAANAAQATGGGILIPIANANFTYDYSSNRWDSTLPISAPSFIGDGSLLTNVVSVINANALIGNTLASGVNYSNLQSFGTVSGISSTGNISTTGNIYANVFVGNIVTANILSGDGGNISNINALAIMGSIPYALFANSAQTANLAALATQAVNSQNAILAQTANLATYATTAGTATTATYAVQADNANAAIVAGMAYQLASTANISVAGNITTDGYFFGNGAYITGISVVVDASNITFSNTTISTVATLEPIVIKTYDTANSLNNLWTFKPDGTLSAAGNIIVNNNLLFPGNAAVTTTIPGNIIANVNVVALTNGINGNGWSNYLALDSNGNVHIGKNSGNTSGSLIWDGGGSSIYESTTNGLVIASFAQYATIASGLTVQGNAFANNFSTIGNVYAGNVISGAIIANTGAFTNTVSIGSILSVAGNIRTSGNISATGNISASYYFGNGSYLTGVIPNTGNIGFIGDTIYDLNGPTLNNSDLSHGATAGLVIPANGNTQPATLTNIYGNIVLGASLTGAGGISNWTFGGDGKLTFPNGDLTIFSQGGLNSIQADDGKSIGLLSSGSTGGIASVWVEDIGNTGSSNIAAVYANPTPGVAPGSGIVRIAVGQNGGAGPNLWDFNQNGNLTLPYGAVIKDTAGNAVAFGEDAGNSLQGISAVAVGNSAGATSQGIYAVAIGAQTGKTSQGNGAVAVGSTAGFQNQGDIAVAIGTQTGVTSQGVSAVAIGYSTGYDSQGINAVAIGSQTGEFSQGNNAVAIGGSAGSYKQGEFSVAIGRDAGQGGEYTATYVSGAYPTGTTLVVNSTTGIATGMFISGNGFVTDQTVVTVTNSTTLQISASADSAPSGTLTFSGYQGTQAVAVGLFAGNTHQGTQSVAVGVGAGQITQGTESVAVGASAGTNSQGNVAVAVGSGSGQFTQGLAAVAVGYSAGNDQQRQNAVAVGSGSGQNSQGNNAVAIGAGAGTNTQGVAAVAIGYSAGENSQGNNSIILNATGAGLNQTTANTFTVAPVRNDVANVAQVMFYNTTSKEITYGNTISVAGNVAGNYILGNGAFLSGVITSVANINNGNSNVAISAADANVTVSVSGVGNVAVFTPQGLSVTGNITGNYYFGNGSQLTGVVATGVGTLGNLSVTGNANVGNVNTAGNISAVGNITGNYYFGNGINLTGLANITFGSTPPANAIIGDTWIDSTTGIQYVYFNDITGNIWAEMEAQTTYASVGYANLTTNTLNTQVLYNASNAIVGSNNLTFDGTTLSAQGVTVGNALQISGNSILSTSANANLTIDTTGNSAYINMRGGFNLTSYNGNKLMDTVSDTVNFYTPILNSIDSAIDIIGTIDGNTLPPETSGVMLHITGQPTLPSRVYNDGINTYAGYIGRAYNGNVNAPTAILANTIVSRFGSLPYSNVGFPALTTTRIDMVTTENQTSSNLGSQINFWSTPTGSNTIAQTATLNSAALSVTGNVIGGNVIGRGIVNSSNFIANVTSTVSSSANVTLTATSNYNQIITGTAAQNFFLPNATTLIPGTGFLFNVNSSQPTYIYYQDATLFATIPAGGITWFILLSNGTANGSWDRHSSIPSYAGWGSSALAMGGANITGGTNISVTGIVSATGNVIGGNVRASTVNTIPTLYTNLIAVAGSRAFITDGNLIASGNFGNQVSGGGSNTVPVWSNGTNWYIG